MANRNRGLQLDTREFLGLDPLQVIDATPEAWKGDNNRLWRGASLGALALNLAKGDFVLNPKLCGFNQKLDKIRRPGISASYLYSTALGFASPGGHWRQFLGGEDSPREEFRQLIGYPVPLDLLLPGIIYSIEGDQRVTEIEFDVVKVSGRVPFSDMDDYSRQRIEEIFDIEIPSTGFHMPNFGPLLGRVASIAGL